MFEWLLKRLRHFKAGKEAYSIVVEIISEVNIFDLVSLCSRYHLIRHIVWKNGINLLLIW